MSDQPPPPKPKPGSLRDRIAAFEKSAAAGPAPAPAPAPRPKPAGFQSWKPKAPSPPESPKPSVDNASTAVPKAGGMSASDAKESITKAGSLKDRMAALQGKGAFGAPPVPAAKPQIEKPKWKPPPVVHAPVDEEDSEKAPTDIAAAVEKSLSPPAKPQDQHADAEAQSTETDMVSELAEESAEVVDPEEEERQRRAAIAARMARLGGARVGMAPPVFAKKPPVRRPTQESEASVKMEAPSSTPNPAVEAPLSPAIMAADASASPPAVDTTASTTTRSPEIKPARKNSESVSILSADSAESQSPRAPASMPMSAVPRRTGPPRKKPAKAVPPPPPTDESAEPVEAVAQRDKTEISEEDIPKEQLDSHPDEKEPVVPITSPDLRSDNEGEAETIRDQAEATSVHAAISSEKSAHESVSALSSSLSRRSESSAQDEEGVVSPPSSRATPSAVDDELAEDAGSDYSDEQSDIPTITSTAAPVGVDSAKSASEPSVDARQSTDSNEEAEEDISVNEEEESEDARKKRVAERIAKMGGFNPFAPPPAPPTIGSQTSPRSSLASPSVTVAASVPLPVSPPVPAITPSIAGPVTKSEVGEEPSEASLDDESEVEDAEDTLDNDGQHEYRETPLASSHLEHQPEQQGIPRETRLPPQQRQSIGSVSDNRADGYSLLQDQAATEQFTEPHTSSVPSQPAELLPSPGRPAQPPRRIIPQTPEPDHDQQQEGYSEDDSDRDSGDDDMLAQSHLYIPPPSAQRSSATVVPGARYIGRHDEDGNGSESDTPALPYRQRRSVEISPQRARSPLSEEDVSEPETDHDGQALPIPPRQSSGLSSGGGHDIEEEDEEAAQSNREFQEVTPMVSISTSNVISDDEEGDPIDPSFHSPSRSPSISNFRTVSQTPLDSTSPPTSARIPDLAPPPPPSRPVATPAPHSARSSPPSKLAEQSSPPRPPPSLPDALSEASTTYDDSAKEDQEHDRRRTIAERMAKLGGIKFGAAPPALPKQKPPPPTQEIQEDEEVREAEEEMPAAIISEEDEERARKERIAAKMASMGGMRIGMLPMGMGQLPQQRTQVQQGEDVVKPPPPPQAPRAIPPSRPAHAPPPPPPPVVADTDSEYSTEDGVKVEAEESEVDEVTYDDVQEGQEETPPPVPSRTGRGAPHRQSTLEQAAVSSPTSSSFRPPVPMVPPTRRASGQTMRSERTSEGIAASPPSRRVPVLPTHSDFVMVDEPQTSQPDEEQAPAPPPRPISRVPPSRSSIIPQAPVPEQRTVTLDSTGDWELPSISMSTLDFGGGADLSLSWTDAGESVSPTMPSHPPPQLPAQVPDLPGPSEKQQQKPLQTMSADELMIVWGRVGVQICEAATTMFEKSKKGVVGDGTYAGFVAAVFAAVPNASKAHGYGYLVYTQNGSAVQKRASDIMPGDVVQIVDAKFKGHKGIQTYQQHVGSMDGEGPLVGVVGEFEAKKTKIRVFQANHHVGQQTVESVSYRLEDLKSGIVKVYRVLEV